MTARLACTALLALACGPALGETRTYAGEDAQRVKCAAMLSLVSNFAESEGRLQPGQQEISRAAIGHLLDGLPGTSDEKARAMQDMADRIMVRSGPEDLKAEFERTLPACGRFFGSGG